MDIINYFDRAMDILEDCNSYLLDYNVTITYDKVVCDIAWDVSNFTIDTDDENPDNFDVDCEYNNSNTMYKYCDTSGCEQEYSDLRNFIFELAYMDNITEVLLIYKGLSDTYNGENNYHKRVMVEYKRDIAKLRLDYLEENEDGNDS